MDDALATIVADLKREPSPTGSLVITVFGDAIVPRGGAVWLGTLLAFFALLDIDGGGVRTAVSRLASDGWLERRRIGRNSFYSLADKGRARFDAAMRHVYDAPPAGALELLLLNGARDDVRSTLRAAGLGSPQSGVWIASPGTPILADVGEAIRITIDATSSHTRKLVEASWDLAEMAQSYRRFVARFGPLRDALSRGTTPHDGDAFVARILLVNSYRRVSLRDPLLTPELLPADWPGAAARALCRDVYRALLPDSERWLDRSGTNEAGPLPSATRDVARRFAE